MKPEDWTVTVCGDDDLYDHATAFLQEHRSENWRKVEASMTETFDDNADRWVPDVKLKPNMAAEVRFTLDGHDIHASIDTGFVPVSVQKSADLQRVKLPAAKPKVVFVADSEAGQQAVSAALIARANAGRKDRKKRKPQLLVSSGGYRFGWQRKGDLQPRPLASVATTNGQVEEIVDDIRTFLGMEGEYARRGIPFHRGYLIYGPPGTGKTSAVKAIATELGMDLYVINLGSIGEDSSLSSLFEEVKANSFVLLEDIDAFGAARDRDVEDGSVFTSRTGANSGVSISGLLNALDGVDTPHGLITVMTTNHKELLDGALLRPGRVDKHVFFGNPDDATVERHFTFFYDRPPSVPLVAAGRSGAEVHEVMVSRMFDPEDAERVLSAPPVRSLEVAA